jgi:hypothetical protein
MVWRYKTGTGGLVRAMVVVPDNRLLAERIELIAKKTIHFSCHFNEWAIFSMTDTTAN